MPVNARAYADRHEWPMRMNRLAKPATQGAALAERLRAYSRLCEQIAQVCWNAETAEKLHRMAQDCTGAAQQACPWPDAPEPRRH
jgi:hypothetical protein